MAYSNLHPAANRGNGIDFLAMLQAPASGQGKEGPGFSSALEDSVRRQESSQPQRESPPPRTPEPSRGQEHRPVERNPSAERPDRTETDRSRPQHDRTETREADRDANSASDTSAESGEAGPAGRTGNESRPTEAEGEDAATDSGLPANLASIAAIIAALRNESDPDGENGTMTGALLAEDGEHGEEGAGGARTSRSATLFATLGARAAQSGVDAGTSVNLAQSATSDKGEASSAAFQSTVDALIARSDHKSQNAFAQVAGRGAVTPQTEIAASGTNAGSFVPGLRSPAGVPQLQVATPAGQRMWAEDVGNRMLWMVGRGESRAELVLTPPSLGKLGVSIQVNGDQTSAHFVASSSAAREALEQAMPRLREILQQAGINLGQTDVSTSGEQQAGEQRDADAGAGRGSGAGRFGTADAADEPVPQSGWRQIAGTGSGAIDIFA